MFLCILWTPYLPGSQPEWLVRHVRGMGLRGARRWCGQWGVGGAPRRGARRGGRGAAATGSPAATGQDGAATAQYSSGGNIYIRILITKMFKFPKLVIFSKLHINNNNYWMICVVPFFLKSP